MAAEGQDAAPAHATARAHVPAGSACEQLTPQTPGILPATTGPREGHAGSG